MSDDDDWDRTVFDADLKAILDAKLPVSASKITGLQSLALKHPKASKNRKPRFFYMSNHPYQQHHNYIVHCIVRFIETSPPDYRLAGLYVVDAISRAVQKMQRKGQEEGKSVEAEGYLRRFGVVLKDESLRGAFAKCSDHDKVSRNVVAFSLLSAIWSYRRGMLNEEPVNKIGKSQKDARYLGKWRRVFQGSGRVLETLAPVYRAQPPIRCKRSGSDK